MLQKEIADKLEVSEGSVSGKLKIERKKSPDLDDLRKLNMALRKGDVSHLDAMRAARVLAKVDDAGVELKSKDLAGSEKLFAEKGDEMGEAIEAGEYIMDLEKTEGKSFGELRREAERLKDIIIQRTEDYGRLDVNIQEKKRELGDVQVYEQLKRDLESMGTEVKAMAGFIRLHNRLVLLGFDEKIAVALATELQKRGLVTEEAVKDMVQVFEEFKSLDKAVGDLQTTRKNLEELVIELGKKKEKVEIQLGRDNSQAGALEQQVVTLKETAGILNRSIEDAGKNAKKSMDTMVTEATTAIGKVRGEAEAKVAGAGNDLNDAIVRNTAKFAEAAESVKTQAGAAESAIDEAMKRAIDVGKQIQGLEPIVRVYRFISDRTGKPEEVYPIAVDFMESLSEWQRTLHGYGYLRTYELDGVLKEMRENWGESVTR